MFAGPAIWAILVGHVDHVTLTMYFLLGRTSTARIVVARARRYFISDTRVSRFAGGQRWASNTAIAFVGWAAPRSATATRWRGVSIPAGGRRAAHEVDRLDRPSPTREIALLERP